MRLIRENILRTTGDTYIKIPISSVNQTNGGQEAINSLMNSVSDGLINNVTDAETRRFKYDPSVSLQHIGVLFGNSTNYSYLYAGFTVDEILNGLSNFTNSFFILDFYDSYDENTQTKIMRTYLTQKKTIAKFDVDNALINQESILFIPQWFINQSSGYEFLYFKIKFFNAKTGKVQLFYNNKYASDSTTRRIYFKVGVNTVNRVWKLIDIDTAQSIVAKEITTSTAYTDKINNAITVKPNIQQIYPSGDTFNYQMGNYE